MINSSYCIDIQFHKIFEFQMFVPKSKFRHTFGCPAKKEQCYEGLKVTSSAHDGSFCAVNPVFLAVVVESAGGGVFVVLPLEKVRQISSFYNSNLN